MHDAPRHLRRHASHPFVDRHYAADVHPLIPVVRSVPGKHLIVGIRELEAAAAAAVVDRAEQRDLAARRQHVRQERLIEENCPHLARRVADHRLEDPESAPLRAALSGAQDGAQDRGGVARPQLRDGPRVLAVVVAPRQAQQEILEHVQARPLQVGGAARADALDELQRRAEILSHCAATIAPASV